MIISEVLFIYFLLWLILIAVLWRREEVRTRRNEWRVIFHCDKCRHSFVNRDRGASLCRCPSCNAVCIRSRTRNF